MSVTTGMVGGGFYDHHSAPQRVAIERVLPWAEAAIASMLIENGPGPAGLADFGCSEGSNSVAVMQRLVAAFRARSERPIQTIHSDLPTNDFSDLFLALRPDGASAFDAPRVYSCAVGGSMYEQLVPSASLTFATSFNALGFLSRRPLDRLPGYILPNGPSKRRNIGEVTQEQRRVFAAQALQDMTAFLAARAAELVPGGMLLMQTFGSGYDYRTCDGIYDVLNDAVLEVLQEGRIDRDAYEAYYQPVYFRHLDELIAPVAGEGAPLARFFRLERAETYEIPVPFVEAFRRDRDVERYAKEYTDFFRAFTEPVLRLAFSDHKELDALVTDIYARAERLVRETPENYEFHYVAVAAIMTRR